MSPDRRSPTEWSKRLAETFVDHRPHHGDTAVAVLSEAASSGRPVAAVLADRGLVDAATSRSPSCRGSPGSRRSTSHRAGRWVRRSASCPSCSPTS